MSLRVRSKIALLANICITLPLIIIISIIYVEKNNAAEENLRLIDEMTTSSLTQLSKDVYAICDAANSVIQSKLNSSLKLLEEKIGQNGGLKLSNETVAWEALNQFDKSTQQIVLPKLMLGNTWLGKNADVNVKTPLIDNVADIMDATFTIFQRMNEQGDMLRVATTIQKLDGNRAIGTFIPAVNPDGQPNSVISKIMNKEEYRGSAFVVNKVYQTLYLPLLDDFGEVIGVIYVGVRQEQDEGIRNSIMDIKVGKTGYVYILQGNGPKQGEYVISYKGQRDGENLMRSDNPAVAKVGKDVVEIASKLKGNETGLYTYFWQNKDETEPREKITLINYYQPWDWVIGVGAYKEDFMTISDKMLASLEGLIVIALVTALIVNIILGLFVFGYLKKLMRPLEDMAAAARNLAAGKVDNNIEYDKDDEIGELASSFRDMQGSLTHVIDEISSVTQSTSAGQLDKRADAAQFQGSYSDIIQGLNQTLDAVIKPLNVTAEYVDRISKGDIPSKITEEYKGDFNEIKNNINQLIDILDFFVQDMLGMYEQQKAGDLDVMMQSDKLLGVYSKMADGVNNVAQIHINNIMKILDITKSYSEGDLTPVLEKLPGKQVIANERLDLLRNTLKNIISELNEVSINIEEGKLTYRANADNFRGAYKEIIGGLNNSLDLVITPLNTTAEYIARISNGEIPPKFTAEAKGDFNAIKNNVNALIDNLNSFIADMLDNYEQHEAGDTDAAINHSKYKGAYAEMALGVNNSVKLYTSLLGEILTIVEAYANGDFGKVLRELPGKQKDANDRMDILRTNLLNVVSEIEDLSGAIRVGNLEYNCDTTKFNQDWAKLVAGLNTMKDEVAKPVNTINSILGKIALNDHDVEFDEGYEGLWLELQGYTQGVLFRIQNVVRILKNISYGVLTDVTDLKKVGKRSENDELIPSMILMIESIQALVDDAEDLAEHADAGRLDKRADESKHQGEFKQVIQGFNKTIDNLVEPLRIAASFADAISKGASFDRLTNDYEGEYKIMADNINVCLTVMDDFGQDIFNQTQAAINGKLDQRSDINKYSGNWKSMVTGMNQIMDAMAAPLTEAGNILEELASGDLRSRMKGEYEGEFDKLSLNINKLGNSLQDLIRNVVEVVEAVSVASNQISLNSNTVASASQEQSSQAEEIATAIEEMARTVTENADNAVNTSSEAKNNGQIASEGGKIVEQTVQKMQDIADVVSQSAINIQKLGDSGQQIGQIISVIEEIADQTNLLALNAAIEAARAGEQGRGFAVVADEVRKLAERTTEATKQISNMIKGVQNETESAVLIMHKGNDEVKLGIEFADKAGQSLGNIVNSTNKVLDMITHIASASEEQSATTEQIAKNITAISTVSQDTAEQISHIAEAATRMNDYTSQLNLVINQFKIDNYSSGDDDLELRGRDSNYLMPH